MAGNVPGTDALAEVVRAYAKALIASGADRKGTGKVERGSGGSGGSGPTFGNKESGKKKKTKKKKKTSFVVTDETLLASLRGQPPPSEAQLAELAKQARQALEQAEKLAGEPVAYIAAMIVPARLVRKDSPFRQVERYKIINEWR